MNCIQPESQWLVMCLWAEGGWHRKICTYHVISSSCMANRCQWQRCNVGWCIHVGLHKLCFYYVYALKTNIVYNGLQIPHVLKQQQTFNLNLHLIICNHVSTSAHYWLEETGDNIMIGPLMKKLRLIACGIKLPLSQSPPNILLHAFS